MLVGVRYSYLPTICMPNTCACPCHMWLTQVVHNFELIMWQKWECIFQLKHQSAWPHLGPWCPSGLPRSFFLTSFVTETYNSNRIIDFYCNVSNDSNFLIYIYYSWEQWKNLEYISLCSLSVDAIFLTMIIKAYFGFPLKCH